MNFNRKSVNQSLLKQRFTIHIDFFILFIKKQPENKKYGHKNTPYFQNKMASRDKIQFSVWVIYGLGFFLFETLGW